MSSPDTTSAAPPSVDELLERMPHRPPMRLISRVISSSERAATCRIIVGDTGIPGYTETPVHWSIGIEYMAQTTALVRGASSSRAQTGMVVSIRTLKCDHAGFVHGEELEATATLDSVSLDAALFQCAVVRKMTGETVMSARIAVATREEFGIADV